MIYIFIALAESRCKFGRSIHHFITCIMIRTYLKRSVMLTHRRNFVFSIASERICFNVDAPPNNAIFHRPALFPCWQMNRGRVIDETNASALRAAVCRFCNSVDLTKPLHRGRCVAFIRGLRLGLWATGASFQTLHQRNFITVIGLCGGYPRRLCE